MIMELGFDCYSGFCEVLLNSGFSMAGGNSKGIYAAVPFGWEEQDYIDSPIKWHTGNEETDPWEWRMRVLEERNDIAYAKLFFKAGGFISREWYPLFLACRRYRETFEEAYSFGTVSREAKIIYDIIEDNGTMALHLLKKLGGFDSADKSKFDKAITELQMRMFITMCGRQQRRNKMGLEYGWNTTVFCTTEEFWRDSPEVFDAVFSPQEAENRIKEQIIKLNPNAEEKTMMRFIYGK